MDKILRKQIADSFKDAMSEANISFKKKLLGSLNHEEIEVVCTIGIIGQHHGFFHLAGTKESIKNLTHLFSAAFGVAGDFSNTVGPFEKTTLGEIANQVMGRWCTALSSQNIDCNITPPTIMTGKNIQDNPLNKGVSKPFYYKGNFGTIRFHIELKN